MSLRSFTDNEIIAALNATRGRVHEAAELLGCVVQTIYTRLNTVPSVAMARINLEGRLLDVAEERLFEAIDAGEPWAIRFYLATKGKRRGYTTATEITGAEGAPIAIEPRESAGERIAKRIEVLSTAFAATADSPGTSLVRSHGT